MAKDEAESFEANMTDWPSETKGGSARAAGAKKRGKPDRFDQETEFLRGLPYFNIGALVMPAIWGPGHGMFITLLFYPLWLFVDNVLYGAYSNPTPLSIAIAVVVFVVMLAFTLFFGRMSQPYAAHRAAKRGKTREKYLAEERTWAIAMCVVGVVLLALATYYNLAIRPGLE